MNNIIDPERIIKYTIETLEDVDKAYQNYYK